jgi:hypothetical protein
MLNQGNLTEEEASVQLTSLYYRGWKTTLLTSVFFILTSVFFNYADGILRMLIRMFADVRWVGFLPPLVLTSLGQLLSVMQTLFPFNKPTYLNEEVNCTEPSPSDIVPWLNH